MKKYSKYLYFAFIALMIISCEPTDNIINNISTSSKFLMAYKEPNTLALTTLPEKTNLYTDIYSEINGSSLTSPVTRMVGFYSYYFVFRANEYKIDVLNKSDFKLIQTMDFSAEKKKPLSICFPNVTDAYIIFEKDSSVMLYDIVNFKPARSIIAGRYPTSIAAYGNQIYLTNQLDNTVSVIDSRTHKVEQTIQVHNAPTFVDFTPDGTKAVVISLGAGKIDSTQAKTAALASFIDVSTRLVIKTKQIGTGAIVPANQYPQAFTITNRNIAVIATKDYVFRLETKFGDMISLANRGSFSSVGYNFQSDEVMMIKKDTKNTTLIIADPLSISQKSSYIINSNITSILPI